jgi:hypothetical protein
VVGTVLGVLAVLAERGAEAVVLDELSPVLEVLASPSLPLIVGVRPDSLAPDLRLTAANRRTGSTTKTVTAARTASQRRYFFSAGVGGSDQWDRFCSTSVRRDLLPGRYVMLTGCASAVPEGCRRESAADRSMRRASDSSGGQVAADWDRPAWLPSFATTIIADLATDLGVDAGDVDVLLELLELLVSCRTTWRRSCASCSTPHGERTAPAGLYWPGADDEPRRRFGLGGAGPDAPIDPSYCVAIMDVAALASAIAAVAAAIALLLSLRQIRLLTRQNLSPVVLEAFREARMDEWFEAFDWIHADLAREFSPERGVSGLPIVARRRVRKVGFFYDNLGVLVVAGVVPEDLVLGFFGPGMQKCWDVIKPYFDAEGAMRGIRYLVFYEHLVCLNAERDVEDRYRSIKLRRLEP